MRKTLCLLLAGTLLLSACSTRENDPVQATSESLNQALREAVDNSLLPAVDGFHNESQQLVTDAETFCTTINAANLNTLQQQWRNLYRQWFRLANYNFGPLNADFVFAEYIYIDSLRLNGQNYLSTVRDEISDDIADDDTLDDNYFNNKNFDKVGLLALESLIFETSTADHSPVTTAIVNDYDNEARKCDILLGLARQLQTRALDIKEGWHLEYSGNNQGYRAVFLNNQLADGTNNLTQLIAAVQDHLDYLKKRHVASVGSPVAGDVWQALSSTMNEVETLLNGTDDTVMSFFEIMESAGHEQAVSLVRANIAAIRQNISDRNSAVVEINLGKLDGNFKREIPDSLEVQLGLNFSDGD